jgi:DNA-binding CsgD family transcriptional regulator
MRNERDQYAILKCARDEGEARGEARVLELMAKGYNIEQIKEILKGE